MRGVLGRNWRWRREEAVPAPLRLAFVAGVVDTLAGLAVVEAARRASGAPYLWSVDFGEAEPPGRLIMAVTLSLRAAAVACGVLADGRTLGRAVAGIRLEMDTGRPLDLRTAAIREFSKYGTAFVFKVSRRMVLGADAPETPEEERRVAARIWAVVVAVVVARTAARAADPQKRSLEDRIARTRPVRSRPGRRR